MAKSEALYRISLAEFVAGATDARQLPPAEVAEFAFAGRSNVGKSSLLNTMLERKKLVRTSSHPGCTRQINVFRARLQDGLEVHFVDLPGYGYAKISKEQRASWGPMLETFIKRRETLRGVIILVDMRRGFEQEEQDLIAFLQHERPELAIVLVATKLDKLKTSERKPRLQAFQKEMGTPVLGFSAETGEGRAPLWSRLQTLATEGEPAEEPPLGNQ